MNAIEFETIIETQTIQLPNAMAIPFGQKVRIIMLYDAKLEKFLSTSHEDAITQLVHNPMIIQDFSPMTREEIYER